MRVLFVYPNLYTQMGFNHGLASLSACLKRDGHETRLVNLNENLPPVPTNEEILGIVRDWRPGLIAFSCLTQQYRPGLELARWLREAAEREGLELPPIIVGGIHPTMVPLDVLADGDRRQREVLPPGRLAQPARELEARAVLLRQAGERDQPGLPLPHEREHLLARRHRRQVLVQVDEPRLVTRALQHRRQRREAVVEPHLRVEVRVDEEDAHRGVGASISKARPPPQVPRRVECARAG